jgi:hypothetical protein
MRTKVKKESPDLTLLRILDAFARELIDVPDEEIIETANALGMDLMKRESAAFAGVTYPTRWQLSDFFDVDPRKVLQQEDTSRRPKRSRASIEKKVPGGK